MTNSIIEEVIKPTLCKHCDVSYPATKEFFYTKKGKMALDICKDCKKINMINYNKSVSHTRPINKRDRKQYFRDYRLKIKLQKEALNVAEN